MINPPNKETPFLIRRDYCIFSKMRIWEKRTSQYIIRFFVYTNKNEEIKMKCIIGLGNPGKKYAQTRHNIGFMVIDELLERFTANMNKNKFKCDYTIDSFRQEKVMFIKPQTFMNLSGEGVKPLLEYYQIDTSDILVVYDDLDLPTGKIRLREKGGHGGHNGIRSLIDYLGTKEFKRLRIGIGRPTNATPIVNYVLQPFAKNEMKDVNDSIIQSAEASEMWLHTPFHEVMNKYNM